MTMLRALLPALLLSGTLAASAPGQPGPLNAITDVPGVKVGQYEDPAILSGTTVVLVEQGAVGGVDVRGSAPGTRETDLLNPMNLVEKVQAIMLSGGSAYGLAAADGVMRFLEEKGLGYPVGEGRVVPIVPAAILFDLGRGGDWKKRPTADFGYRAAQAARGGPVAQGNVGAGTGAYAGAVKGGVGTASVVLDGGVVVGAIVAVNPAGSVYDPQTGDLYGRSFGIGKEFGNLKAPTGVLPASGLNTYALNAQVGHNTTIGVVATNARLTKAQAQKIAQMTHDGLARAIRPVHTMFDGDTVFALGTGEVEVKDVGQLSAIGAAAADVMTRAIVHAILNAKTVGTQQSYCDKFPTACR
ncbi:P1 family peptidase [Deinococcus aluminii]|uniref:Aminopeptidase Rv1333 n=1 Tax=Deinococcus aluminii TaxID=1656885 RepID=A0ABP9XDU0_9DEIO